MDDQSKREGLPGGIGTGHLEPPRGRTPMFRWPGGKSRHAEWIVSHFPRAAVYVEPYVGAGSVFWNIDPPMPVEVLNDLDGEIVNVFRCLQDPATFDAVAHRIFWTPYSLEEYRRSVEQARKGSPVDRAWAFMVTHNMGYCGNAMHGWGRVTSSTRGMPGTASMWRNRISALRGWHDRLTRVQLDNRDALEVIEYWDADDTLTYLDPPYSPDTRGVDKFYGANEQGEDHHKALVDLLLNLKGFGVLSGYETPIYQPLIDAGWGVERREVACGLSNYIEAEGDAPRRTECLYLSPRVLEGVRQPTLFSPTDFAKIHNEGDPE